MITTIKEKHNYEKLYPSYLFGIFFVMNCSCPEAARRPPCDLQGDGARIKSAALLGESSCWVNIFTDWIFYRHSWHAHLGIDNSFLRVTAAPTWVVIIHGLPRP